MEDFLLLIHRLMGSRTRVAGISSRRCDLFTSVMDGAYEEVRSHEVGAKKARRRREEELKFREKREINCVETEIPI